MAMLLRPKVPLRTLYLRHISTAKQDKTTSEHEQLDFGNTKEAYRSKTFSELLRNYVVFKIFSFKILVDNNKTVRPYLKSEVASHLRACKLL